MEAGERIDGWVVEARLGTGGMGSVYRCRNASTERIVAALKVLDRSLRSNPDASTRFVREAEILAGLDHPNIVRVRNVRVDADPPYLEMEFVEGEPLDAIMRRGSPGYDRTRRFALQMAEAVAYLHARGVRHRDLKPANVLVAAGDRVRIVDFGLATEANLERITEEGLSFGTVSYAPPEWMEPERLDPVQWDLYALGVVFYELLTGRVAYPMSGEGAVKKQLLQVMMNKQLAAPLDPGPSFHPDVRSLVGDLTRLDPRARPQSAAEVLERLQALPEHQSEPGEAVVLPSVAPGPQALIPTVPPRSGRMWFVPAVAILGVVGIGAAVWVWRSSASTELVVVAPTDGAGADVVVPVPEIRTVEVRFQGAPPSMPIRVALGEHSAVARDGFATLAGVGTGPATLTWVAGEGCDACPGAGCPRSCGVGEAPVAESTGTATLVVPVRPGSGDVTIDVPALAGKDGKGKRKRRWDLSGRLADRTVTSDGTSLRFRGVPPGRHSLVVDVGECPVDAAGCWPGDGCPDKCRSDAVDVMVPFEGGEVHLRTEVPTP